mmetsp:Transcript_68370/g.154809  ORF Transcript_68370/g.154809 Transcript_68370/m.154809 type:complete len:204 (-) Transcript_68370:449-1060(-)
MALVLCHVVLVVCVHNADDMPEKPGPPLAMMIPAEMLGLLQDENIPRVIFPQFARTVSFGKDAPQELDVLRLVPTKLNGERAWVNLGTIPAPSTNGFLLHCWRGKCLAVGKHGCLVFDAKPGDHQHNRPTALCKGECPQQRVDSSASEPWKGSCGDDGEMPPGTSQVRYWGACRYGPQREKRRLRLSIEQGSAKLLHDSCTTL